jgi:hypothetical protein
VRTGEQEPGDGELVKFAVVTSDAARFEAARLDAARLKAAKRDAARLDAAGFEASIFDAVAFGAVARDASRVESRETSECSVTHCSGTHRSRTHRNDTDRNDTHSTSGDGRERNHADRNGVEWGRNRGAVNGSSIGNCFGEIECGEIQCDDLRCDVSADVENTGFHNPIGAVAEMNERSLSGVARTGRARCTGLSHPELAPIEFENPFGNNLMCPELQTYLRCKSPEGAINLRTVL